MLGPVNWIESYSNCLMPKPQDCLVFLLSGPYFPSQLPAAYCPPFNGATVGEILISVFLVYVSHSKSILVILASSHVLSETERNVG